MELSGVAEGMKYDDAIQRTPRKKEFPSAKLTPAHEVR
jgi:hypothetical protein